MVEKNAINLEPQAPRARTERNIRTMLNDFAVSEMAFKNDPQETIIRTAGMLEGYGMNEEFVSDPEKLLFSVAITDQLLTENNAQKQRALHSVLKLIAVGPSGDNPYTTQSRLVDQMAKDGHPDRKWFHPEYYVEEPWRDTTDTHAGYAERYGDAALSTEVSRNMNTWRRNSLLHHVRKNLDITQKNEKEYKVVVVGKTTEEMRADNFPSGYYMPYNDTIVVAQDYHNHIEHEYAHSQSEGLSMGYFLLFYRGLNEAITEDVTKDPKSYPYHRRALHVLENIPGFREHATKAYKGNDTARKELASDIISTYGFDGFLSVARMHKVRNPNEIESQIYVSPLDTLKLLGDKDGRPYFNTR